MKSCDITAFFARRPLSPCTSSPSPRVPYGSPWSRCALRCKSHLTTCPTRCSVAARARARPAGPPAPRARTPSTRSPPRAGTEHVGDQSRDPGRVPEVIYPRPAARMHVARACTRRVPRVAVGCTFCCVAPLHRWLFAINSPPSFSSTAAQPNALAPDASPAARRSCQ